MKKYDISVSSERWSIVSLSANEAIPDLDEHTISVIPDYRFDVRILCTSYERVESVLPSLLRFYYSSLLGYPKMTLDVSVLDRLIELEIFDTPRDVKLISDS